MAVHRVAQGFNLQVEAYERARPAYPSALVADLLGSLNLLQRSTAPRVLEIGSGTGKFTRSLLELGLTDVTAVEPAPGMRAKFAELFPSIPLLDGTAESIPVENSSVDAVFIAQAFHWFATEAALTEIARVLKPGGGLGLIWNMESSGTPWVAKLREMVEAYEDGAPQYRHNLWRRAFQLPAAELFSPLEHRTLLTSMTCTKQMVWDRVVSKSYIANLDDDKKQGLKQRLLAMVEATCPEFSPGSPADATIEFPCATDAYWAIKK